MPQDGWEFYILDPTDRDVYPVENTQNVYNKMYTSAYNKLIQELCIPNPNDLLQCDKDSTFLYYINCKGDNDIINLDEEYDYKFLKSVFLDKKYNAIKKCIHMYYNSHGIYVKSMYKDDCNYFIELEKKLVNVVN
tara:strand:+ start:9 stop:413 length:405 start_codon:yes stop_codon:yes gene_type:complete